MFGKKKLENKILKLEKEIQGLHHNMMILMQKVHDLEKKNKRQEYFG